MTPLSMHLSDFTSPISPWYYVKTLRVPSAKTCLGFGWKTREEESIVMTPSTSSMGKWLLRKIHTSIGRPPIQLALGRGPEVGPTDTEPLASVLISDWSTLVRLLLSPSM